MNSVKTTGNKFQCLECNNENTLEETKSVGDVVECSFCGIEYEVIAKDGDNLELKVLEEEK